MDADRCPRTRGLHILTGKWNLLILRALRRPKTFSEIQHEYTVITNHVLSRDLHQLIEEGVITHLGERYALTESGEALLAAAEKLHLWAVKYGKMQACPKELACSDCAAYNEYLQGMRAR